MATQTERRNFLTRATEARCTAAGSANEALAALGAAVWGYFPEQEAEQVEALLRGVTGMLGKLTRGEP